MPPRQLREPWRAPEDQLESYLTSPGANHGNLGEGSGNSRKHQGEYESPKKLHGLTPGSSGTSSETSSGASSGPESSSCPQGSSKGNKVAPRTNLESPKESQEPQDMVLDDSSLDDPIHSLMSRSSIGNPTGSPIGDPIRTTEGEDKDI